ncbi:unnamed protein product [Blepharisma stoltei]|uniref:Uncharacterized protein n=1 Tax=Blepharisma stoltei TaxID=1481888 RepID=A0AAU9J5P8_9CILI|nr:unnamed protein product [Blepharisma stoltei]
MKKIILLLFISVYIQAYSVPPFRSQWNECESDLDCPVIDCMTYPCDTFVCEDNKCSVKRPKEACVVGGCSGQLCIRYGESGISTCEWREVYGCYSEYGNCTLIDGKCQWEPTKELMTCINDRS